ncbi:ABC transporter permease [Glaciecola sp. 33A]|jgi:cationic peptide transport system permease protein|uniref:ABC transporter permease n=1 Tax=Glaciecola sp. 33A TaxID=2057807 RepID=UPI000C32B2D2|nr:ABC transporter permease [Glaciecola sp. 33A]PKH99814.1 peptide ABC transporter permease [Glaciecola sp. 33A]
MLNLLLRYINLMVLTIAILIIISFSLAYVFPGDTLTNISGIVPQSNEQRVALEAVFKLDRSIFVQFWYYIENLISGDWGVSSSSQISLLEEISIAFPATIELITYALLVSIFIGIPLGFIGGIWHHKPFDFGVVTFSVVSYSFPVFWLALIFITIFSLQLGYLPLSGRVNFLYDIPHSSGFILWDIMLADIPDKKDAFKDALRHLILPTASIALVTTAIFIRFTRRSIMDEMNKGYIDAAKSRGFTTKQIFFKHGLRNSLLPILPLMAMQISTLITNAMVVETIFSWPGIGNWIIQAIYQRDYPAIRIGMLVVSVFVVTLTITIEFISRAIDPARDKFQRGAV